MKKRVLSALLVLCMACSMVSTVWATETNATSGAPEPASQTLNLDNEQPGGESGADSTGAPSDSIDSTSASSDSTSSGSSSAASDATSDATSGEGDESAASSDSTAASDSTSSSSSASSDSSDSDADEQDTASSDVTGDESGTGAEEESDLVTEQPSAGPESVPSQLNSAPEAAPLTVADEFTATWYTNKNTTSPGITVKLVDEQGEPIQTDVSDQRFSSGSGFDLTEGVNNELVPVIEGYSYTGAYFTTSNENQTDIDYIEVYGQQQNRKGYYWYYLTNKNDYVGTRIWNSTNLTIYLRYVEDVASGPVIITNDIASSGNLVASVTDPSYKEKEITYKWYRNSSTDPNGSTDPITPENVTGTQKNVGNEWLNVALDIESLCNDYPGTDSDAVNRRNDIRKTQYTYRVEAYDGDTCIGEATFEVPYYAQLMNGSFETPVCIGGDYENQSDNQGEATYQAFVQNDTDGLVWKTTSQEGGVEIVSTDPDKGIWTKFAFNDNQWKWYTYDQLSKHFHNAEESADGVQYAELNAEEAGSLYQDVLTVPGAKLNWQLSHRGRDNEGELGSGEQDTMYVLIMPTNKAEEEEIDTQEEVLYVIGNLDKYSGAQVETIRSDNSKWYTHTGSYTVSPDQYLTRFFFVAGDTASGDQTVGNSIDDVWFSPELPDPEEDKGHLVVTKNVTGLTAADLTNYQVTIAVTGNEANVEPQTITGTSFTDPDEDGVYTARVSFQNLPVGNYTVTETVSGVPEGFNAENSTYRIGSGDAQSGKAAAVTISNGETTGLTFTNPYTKDEPADPVDPKIRKYVDDNEDGTYSLSLDVTGDVNVKESAVPLNVLYILDESYSMMWDMDGQFPYKDESSPNNGDDAYGPNPGGDNEKTEETAGDGTPAGALIKYSYVRYNAAKAAIETLNNTLAQNSDLDVQVAMVDFAREAPNSAGNTVSWTSLANFEVADADYDLFASGTNYQAAFNEANKMLDSLPSSRENAQTIVIFVTDGNPNRYDRDNEYDGSEYADSAEEIRTAVETARDTTFKALLQKLKGNDQVYAIGVSDDVELENLQLLFQNVLDGQGSVTQSNDTNDLINYFRGIASEVVGATYCTDVTIADTFSQYAQLVDPQLVPTITITDEEGVPVQGLVVTAPEALTATTDNGVTTYTGTYTFSDGGTQQLFYTYNSVTQQFTLDFPEKYALHDGWTYTITVQIEPTETAYTEYAQNKKQEGNNGYGNVVGDSETDVPGSDQTGWTSSGKPGFYSNTSATLQYDSGDEDDKTKNYLKPVIQVTTGKLTITKAVSGLPDSTDVSGQKFSFTVTGKYADGSPVTGAYGCYTFDHEGKTTVTVTGTGSITLTHLPEGIYTVTEDTSNMSGIVDGFRFDSAKYTVGGEETDDVTVSAGSNSAITVTNVYTRNTQTLTVIKTVAGPMGDTSEDNTFSFVLKLKDENNQPYEPDSIGVVEGTSITFNEAKGGYVFTLSHGDKIQFEIPYGYTATVTEDADNGGYTVYTRKYMTEQPPTGEQVGDDEETAGGYSVNSSKSLEETVTQDYTFDFKNFRDVVAPTGLESNHTTPYVLMITAAGMAGLALIGGIVARRIRRRRQE